MRKCLFVSCHCMIQHTCIMHRTRLTNCSIHEMHVKITDC
uniref:Uncharacterized protein n=1 Tax=Arundo donax TaxID=35708 RepID=A0A0A9A8P9_ARUDO